MASWSDMPYYIREAVNHFLKSHGASQIKFISSDFTLSRGSDSYIVTIEDEKLAAWYASSGAYGDGRSKALITKELLEDQTQWVDLAAHIPSSFDMEKRVIVRIAYLIWGVWHRSILDAYDAAKPNEPVTWAKAEK